MNKNTKGYLSTDDKELEELFGAITSEISVSLSLKGVKAISYDAFKSGVNIMMNKAYKQGCRHTTDNALSILEETFK